MHGEKEEKIVERTQDIGERKDSYIERTQDIVERREDTGYGREE